MTRIETKAGMRRFCLAIVGGERILEGTRLSSGNVVAQWLGPVKSTVVYESMPDFTAIHVTEHPHRAVLWIDADPAWIRGQTDALQGLCEGVISADRERPQYISVEDWPEYHAGYLAACTVMDV